ncbi:hypothetical protein [Actinoplanes utahensis]|uniref:hypothetical protein n=1 Tax=Actinoplanes utahensis TaxID=1869 RepID=UPI0013781104|nr:hypothetical protein [Actinoplanes utahensis]GIF28148.1 hypothetical protein Aut01nite_11340 [Actinoplanes utahensis]
MLAEHDHHLRWREGVEAAHAWRDAEREQAAEHDAAVRRILDQGAAIPDPAGQRTKRA